MMSDSHWNLSHRSAVAKVEAEDYESNKEDSVSAGSQITIETHSSVRDLESNLPSTAVPVTPSSPNVPPSTCTTFDLALMETPPDERKKHRKTPDDCHVLIRWSELERLIKSNF
jgi:hypothetical protein